VGRPRKEGMEYFPHDVDAASDEKIEALRAIHGNDGYALYFMLLERIYRTAEAELDVSKPAVLAALVAKAGVKREKFNEILETAFDVDLFDQVAYEEKSILTSKGVKRRAAEVTAMRERWRKAKDTSAENQEENPVENQEENAEETGESKVKQSKPNKKQNYASEFQIFWDSYPRKDEKKPSYAAWQARLKEGYTPEQILLATKNYLVKCKADKTEQRFIKMAKTFLGPGGHIGEHLEKPLPDPNGGEPVAEWTGPACVADFAAEIARRAQ